MHNPISRFTSLDHRRLKELSANRVILKFFDVNSCQGIKRCQNEEVMGETRSLLSLMDIGLTKVMVRLSWSMQIWLLQWLSTTLLMMLEMKRLQSPPVPSISSTISSEIHHVCCLLRLWEV